MKKSPLFKYQLGLAIIGVFTLVVVGLVFVQASATKQDAATDKRANEIADKLNEYVSARDTIPASLSEASITDVPASITYTKVSSDSFKFCINYKSTSSNFDTSSVALSLATGGKVDPGGYDFSSKSYLYVPTSHHKGENCQTISPYMSGGYGCDSSLFSSACIQPLQSQNSSSSLNDSAQDTERKTDINGLQSHLEAYYASYGYYPTLADMNNPTWVAANMKGLDANALCDPSAKSTSCQLTASPKKGVYSYEADDDSYQNCTTESKCSSYVIAATLSSGSEYTKFSL